MKPTKSGISWYRRLLKKLFRDLDLPPTEQPDLRVDPEISRAPEPEPHPAEPAPPPSTPPPPAHVPSKKKARTKKDKGRT
jgi:hypothetical protein